eukprot:Clim_evm13s150 gene=Clim_evmTU13s150
MKVHSLILGLLAVGAVADSEGDVDVLRPPCDWFPHTFGTKTRYCPPHLRSEYGYDFENLQAEVRALGDEQGLVCRPEHIQMLVRHGTRYPSTGDIRKLDKLQNKLNQLDLHGDSNYLWLKDWENPFHESDDKMLHEIGEYELYEIAKRYRERFPTLFMEKYSSRSYRFTSTKTERAAQSASAFSYGLFEGTGIISENGFQPVAINSASIDRDIQLRFFDNCDKYLRVVKGDDLDGEVSRPGVKTVSGELKKFKKSEALQSLIADVKRKVGLPEDHPFPSYKDLYGIYVMCAYGVNLRGDTTFCDIFEDTDKALKILDFHSELKTYYVRGEGTDINTQMSCPLLTDMWEHIEALVENYKDNQNMLPHHQLKGAFRFAHAETLIPLVNLMGLYTQGEKGNLTADEYETHIKDREFRSGIMSPFSGNIGMVVYKCTGTTPDNVHWKVATLLNERVYKMTQVGCDHLLCDYSKMHHYFRDHYGCNFDEVCSLDKMVDEVVDASILEADSQAHLRTGSDEL